jgi:4-amino-4-deoxy-L-arabinose transferase-like glycosyltransferase
MLQILNSRARWITGVVAALVSVSAGVVAALVSVSAGQAADPVYSVISPLGETTVKMIQMAPRLDTLANKTVCMVSNSAFKVNITMPAIAKELQQNYPGLKIVPYTEMATAYSGADYDAKPAEYKSKGCNAVITGNGG